MKNMKLKTLVAACMALGTSSVFAAAAPQLCAITSAPADAAAAANFANKCTPDTVMYIAGSSALGGAITTVAPADLFEGTVTKIVDNGSPNGATGKNAVSAWYGFGKAGTTWAGKKLFVVYNKQNGSAAGISQLLSSATKDTTIPEADVVTVGPLSAAGVVAATQAKSTVGPNTCTSGADAGGMHVVTCTTHARTQADMGISDVAPVELFALEGTKPAAVTTLTNYPLAMQGFGITVNAKLYDALMAANVAEGILPGSCVAGDLTAACQPSIRRADYASLISTQGSIKSANALLGAASDGSKLVLSRRDDLSGTQASSNIFFADNACANAVDSKGKAIKGVLGGSLGILSTTPDATKLIVNKNATGGGVTNDLLGNAPETGNTQVGATDYAIGVIGLNTAEPARTSTSWKYVKIDGQSPNFNPDGSAAYKQRTTIRSGAYPFVVASYAAAPTNPAGGIAKAYPAAITAMVNGLKDSTLHDLTGIAYLDGADDTANIAAGHPKQSLVHRTNGNNCSPVIK